MAELWPWLTVAGLGVFHGINPAMGWLFAVALGLLRHSRTVVLVALLPIALGHALAVAAVALVVAAAGVVIDPSLLRVAAGTALVGWGLYHLAFGVRHKVRFGMRVGLVGLAAWSFLMATAHGAGLMLAPLLIPMRAHGDPAGHQHNHAVGDSLATVLAAIGVHTLAMLAATGIIAIVVFEWVGVAVLRHAWVNLDRLWSLALVGAGLVLFLV